MLLVNLLSEQLQQLQLPLAHVATYAAMVPHYHLPMSLPPHPLPAALIYSKFDLLLHIANVTTTGGPIKAGHF
jgi:hypothetical protein